MHRNRTWLLLLIPLLWLVSCIKSYDPDISPVDVNKLVVSGVVTDRDGNQTVTITMAASIRKPAEIPVTGCKVTVSDSLGHLFPLTDAGNGNYNGYIDPIYLYPGNSFKISILTPDGSAIESAFDRMTEVPPVDSVYYLPARIPTTNPEKFIKGLQFYADLNGKLTESRLVRLELFETWEYHADYPIEWYYDGKLRHVYPPDYTKDICWMTLMVRNIYVISTQGLIENQYKLFPLHFVDNTTSRLLYGYSLQINQYSLTAAASSYWNQLRVNSTESGGLYERQPVATIGNLRNLSHPEQTVLGYFGVSSVKSKRIFVKGSVDLAAEFYSPCAIIPLSPYGFKDLYPMDYPVYIVGDRNGWQPFIMHKDCVDCRASGGTTKKPDFWPL